MKKLVMIAALAVMMAGSGPGATLLRAGEPVYLILRAPARMPKGHEYYPGRAREVHTHTYAYGWFGVRPRQHFRRSTGHHGQYIQWTRQ